MFYFCALQALVPAAAVPSQPATNTFLPPAAVAAAESEQKPKPPKVR